VIVVDAMLSGLPSAVNAYVTAALTTVGVAVAVKSVVALALPSSTAVARVALPLGAPEMVMSPPHAVIWPSEISPIAIIR